MGTDADRIAWRAAGSLDDLLGLTADFLEGRRGFFPAGVEPRPTRRATRCSPRSAAPRRGG